MPKLYDNLLDNTQRERSNNTATIAASAAVATNVVLQP